MKAEFLTARKRWETFNKENDIKVEILWEHNPEHSDQYFIHYIGSGYFHDSEKIVGLWSDKVDGQYQTYQ
tara:strand:- start:5081 stop:5290 length:210 start_codon:yes stop_codon:yes gene_type:complete